MQTTFEGGISGKESIELHKAIKLRVAKYQSQSMIEKYSLYLKMIQAIELKIKQSLVLKFNYSVSQLESKPFNQIIRLLKKEGVRENIISLLKSNIKNRNYLIYAFWVDQTISNSLGLSLKDMQIEKLDEAMIELETMTLFWDYCDRYDAFLTCLS